MKNQTKLEIFGKYIDKFDCFDKYIYLFCFHQLCWSEELFMLLLAEAKVLAQLVP